MRKDKVVRELKSGLFVIGNILIVFFCTVCTLICISLAWMFRTWPYLTMEELMFQLQSPMEGTSHEMIKEYIVFCIPVTVIALVGITAALIVFRKKKRIYYRLVTIALLAAAAAFAAAVGITWNRLDIGDYAENNSTYSSFVDENYVDPAETVLTFPEEKRNLIYIYLESMETTYADPASGGAFEDNYIPELTELAFENEDFSGSVTTLNGAVPMNYATWTAAALFAQTSGLPLTLPIDGNSMDTQESFLPDMTAIGDILEQEGYNQTFMIGSDGNFGGRSLYFTDHGNYEIEDYYYFLEEGKFPEDYMVWWGFEDEKLFEYAKEKLTELAAQPEPFNFTMLTADTHFEDGYVCRLCDSQWGDDTYANVMSCSSRQVSEFVQWIQEQDFYENTTIVLTGDHLTMDSDFCEDVDEEYERKTYTAYINSAVQPADPEDRREYTTFDNFPTTLASLGVQIEGERLGLGTNLFSSQRTLAELYGIDTMNSELLRKSELMERLTEDIDEDNAELKRRQGTAPTAVINVLPYDYMTGLLQVTIDDFENIDEGISMISLAVWTEEDQSDIQWLEAGAIGDGSYLANISVAGFGYKTGEYHIDVYLIDKSGEQYVLTSTAGYVE